MGNQASDAQTGLLAGLLAEYRQVPALTGLNELRLEAGELHGVREDARGRWELAAATPAIVSFTDKAAKPRFPNFKGLMAAKKHEIAAWSVADLGVEAVAPATTVTTAATLPPRSSGEVISGVDAETAAQGIVEFLAARDLI